MRTFHWRAWKWAQRHIPIPPDAICPYCGGSENLIRHHKDGNPDNNDPENVGFAHRDCHTRGHKPWTFRKKVTA